MPAHEAWKARNIINGATLPRLPGIALPGIGQMLRRRMVCDRGGAALVDALAAVLADVGHIRRGWRGVIDDLTVGHRADRRPLVGFGVTGLRALGRGRLW